MLNGIDTLFAKKFSGNITAEEEALLLSWLSESPANAEKYSEAERTWQLTGSLAVREDEADVDAAWADFMSRVSSAPKRKALPRFYLKAAAAVIVVLFAIVMLRVLVFTEDQVPLIAENAREHADTFHVSEALVPALADSVVNDSDVSMATEPTKEKVRRKRKSSPQIAMIAVSSEDSAMLFTLPDGSRVYLNTNSKLVYPERFAAGANEIYLSGEAYFEASQQELFVICHETRTRSMGSAMNIKGLRDGAVEVSAIKGHVQVTRFKDLAHEILLVKEGEQLRYDAESRKVTKERVSRRDKWWKQRSFRTMMKEFFSRIMPGKKHK